jgi:hypothetical protein
MAGDMQRIFRDEMTDAADNGVREARNFISHAGTNQKWEGSFPDLHRGVAGDVPRRDHSTRSRSDTGEMRDAIERLVRTGRTVDVQVGWIREFEEYFLAQDKGFDHSGYRSMRQAVRGMQLMAHMRAYMRDEVDLAVDRAMRRINNGI